MAKPKQSDLQAVRDFMARIRAEAETLADTLDPQRKRSSGHYVKNECIHALDKVIRAAGWVGHVFTSQEGRA